MSRQARKDTGPELALRRLLHADGFRFRVGLPVPGMKRRTIDIAFTAVKVAVFVDGCFWHGCPLHATWPHANAAWWRNKIETNVARDVVTNRHLTDACWTVVRVWEHEQPSATALVVEDVVRGRRAGAEPDRSVGGGE